MTRGVQLVVVGLVVLFTFATSTTYAQIPQIESRERSTWLPEGNFDDTQPGNHHDFDCSWTADGDVPDRVISVRIVEPAEESDLTSPTTAHPGSCGNSRGASTLRDFRILAGGANGAWTVAADGLSANTTAAVPRDTKVLLRVSSFDFAGSGLLEVSVPSAGDVPAGGLVPVVRLSEVFPRDTDRDGLPDGWEARRGFSANDPDSDEDGIRDGEEDEDGAPNASFAAGRPEDPPGSKTRLGIKGDGLTAWEEYRGFFHVDAGTHSRTEPGHKDLFIWSDTRLESEAPRGSRLTSTS